MKATVARLSLICISTVIISLIFTGQSFARINPETCVGMWLLDEGTGNTAEDSSENDNDGRLTGEPQWVDGKFGKALNFDSDINGDGLFVGEVSERIEIPNSPSLDITGDQITLEGWIKLGKTGQGHSLISKWNAYALRVETDKITGVSWALAPVNHFTVPVTLTRNVWYHVAYTYDGSAMKIHLNGELLDSASTSGNIGSNTNKVWIGANQGGGQVTGAIDEVAIFNVALTEGDIKDIASHGLLGAGAVSPSGKLITTWASIKKH